jgi:hypothetical protein
MRGTTTQFDLTEGKRKQEIIKSILEKELNIVLNPISEKLGDYMNMRSGSVYEIKSDPTMAKSGNLMVELFADITPETFEPGWIYRYQNLTYLCYFDDDRIYMYNYKKLYDLFWKRINFFGDPIYWRIQVGVKNNPNGVVVLIPLQQAEHCLRKIIERKSYEGAGFTEGDNPLPPAA